MNTMIGKTLGSNRKLLLVAMASALALGSLTACANNDNNGAGSSAPSSPSASASAPEATTPAPSQDSQDAEIAAAFKKKIEAQATLADLNAALDADIAKVSAETADELLRQLLAVYETDLPKQQTAFEADALQQQLQKLDWTFTEEQLNKIEDEASRKMALDALAGGYKLETAEGFVFPVVDYGKLKRFDANVSPAMKDYIALLAAESDNKTAADGGLVISWDELASRTLAAEQYVTNYPDSPEKEAATTLYLRYLTNLLYGLDNTPIFDYNTYKILPEITDLYKKIASEHPDTATAKLAQQFLDVLDKTDGYVFRKGDDGGQTNLPEVQQFRDGLEAQARSLLGS
ncbi:hypothetical protein [Cohnella fermenti]|uniref:Uncharacterized protein n=1 Tax=Cohnella fermenti TaxID=2565925 RepID=A0A4S4BFG1_9BACL|nr:hypothetical protein [Cohnella fermenti]THF73056.1 hypothetical protein E6C55_30935 [Cohnella fermenti]